jgi:hypothetical protein
MGLMKRVLSETRDTPPRSNNIPQLNHGVKNAVADAEDGNPGLRPELVTRAILRELADIVPTIESPAHVFAMLKRNLNLSKAALLLPDPDERTYVPWSLTGFDVTTQRRLHIPEDTAYSLFSSRVPLFLVLSGIELKSLEPYFSVREYTSAKDIGLAAFFYEAKLLAILVIGETPYFNLDHTIMQIMYSAYEGNLSSLLFRSRDARISRIQIPLLFSHDQLAPMSHELLTENAGNEVQLMLVDINIERAVSVIGKKAPDTDHYRIRQDILRILNTMLAGLGKVFLFPEVRLVLLRADPVNNPHSLDIELLIHQLNEKLKDFFDELEGQDRILDHRVLNYPKDAPDLEELLSRLTPAG